MAEPNVINIRDAQVRRNIRNLLVGATLPEALDMLIDAVRAGQADREAYICEFICDYHADW